MRGKSQRQPGLGHVRRARTGSRRGAAMVEFALSWTLFFTMTIVGVMDFGRFIWAYNLVAHAARVGTRYAMVRGSKHPAPATAPTVESRVQKDMLILDDSRVIIATTWEPDISPGSVVQVRVSYQFVPVLGVFQPASVNVASTSRKVITR